LLSGNTAIIGANVDGERVVSIAETVRPRQSSARSTSSPASTTTIDRGIYTAGS